MGTLEFPVDRSNVLSLACMLIAGGELKVGESKARAPELGGERDLGRGWCPPAGLLEGVWGGLRQGGSLLVRLLPGKLWTQTEVMFVGHPLLSTCCLLPSGPRVLILIAGLFLPPSGHTSILPLVLCVRIYPWLTLSEDLVGWICYPLINQLTGKFQLLS